MLKQGEVPTTEDPALWKAGQELSAAIRKEQEREKYEKEALERQLNETVEKVGAVPENITLLDEDELIEEKVKKGRDVPMSDAMRRKAQREAEGIASEPSEQKNLYGYSAELSRSSKIVNSLDEISSEEGKDLVAAVLNSKKFDGLDVLKAEGVELKGDVESPSMKSASAKAPLEEDDPFFSDENFHGGFESLSKRAQYNIKTNKTNELLMAYESLSSSEEYHIKSFDSTGSLTEEPADLENDLHVYKSDAFLLGSFDDEEEENVIPYESNKARILGDSVPSSMKNELAELADAILSQKGKISAEEVKQDEKDEEKARERAEAEEAERIAREKQSESMKEILRKAQAEADRQAQMILDKAKSQAQQIIEDAEAKAKLRAEEIAEKAEQEAREKGYEDGYMQGQNQGLLDAANAVNEDMKREAANFREELTQNLETFEKKQDKLLNDNLENLTELALDVAEKIINISLTESKEIVSKMIINAAEECRNKEWAKIYISNEDREIAMNLEKELVMALNQISENVKVVVMEDEPSGTCIIETPDQIIDASAGVQLENVKKIVHDNL